MRQAQEGGVLRQQEERDMMRALSEMPPGGLNHFDPTFILLEGGMGAAVSACMARRHAAFAKGKEKEAEKAKAEGPPAPMPQKMGDSGFALPGLASALAEKRAQTKKSMQRAVDRIMAPKRIMAAQQATAELMDEMGSGNQALQQPPSAKAGFDLPEDEELQEWAKEWLKKPPSEPGHSTLAVFKERVEHRLRCWQAGRAGLELLPVAIVPPHSARSITSRQPLFGKLNPRPTSVQVALPAVTPSQLSAGASDLKETSQDLFLSEELSTDTFPRPVQSRGTLSTTSSVMARGDNMASTGMDSMSFSSHSFQPHGIFRKASNPPGSPPHSAQPLLPFPSHFKEPHRHSKGFSVSETAEFQYLRRCELAGLVPCFKAWQRFGGEEGIIDASGKSLQDADVAVIIQTAVACASQGLSLHSLNLSWNKLTDHGLQEVATLLEKAGDQGEPGGAFSPLDEAGLQLNSLSFAGNTSIRFRLAGISESLGRALSSLPDLALLDFSSVPLHGRPAVSLANYLTECCPSLRCLALAGCGLGRQDQSDCCAIAGLLAKKASFKGLESADFSGNHFGQAGFASAGAALRKSRLKHLSFAGNCSPTLELDYHQVEIDREAEEQTVHSLHSDQTSTAPSLTWSTPDGKKLVIKCVTIPGAVQMQQQAAKELQLQPPATAPVALEHFLELLQANNSLEELDISSCKIGPDTAWVLCEAASGHIKLRVLGLADNPLGEIGLRHTINMIVQMGEHFRSCDLKGCRQADKSETGSKFRHWQPEGSYRLHLRYPYERATLRAILKKAEERHKDVPGRYVKFDHQHHKLHVDLDAHTGLWNVPTTGICNVTYAPPLSRASHARLKGHESAMQEALEDQGVPAQIMGAVTAAAMEAVLTRKKDTFSLARTCKAALGNLGHASHKRRSTASSQGSHNAFGEGSSPRSALASGAPLGTSQGSGTTGLQIETEGVDWMPQLWTRPGLPGTPEGDWHEAHDYLVGCRLTVEPLRFQILRQIFRSLLSAERDRFVCAIAKELYLTSAQVQALLDDDEERSLQNAYYLFPSIVGRKPQLIMLKEVQKSNVERVANAIRTVLWFQEGNPTGSYNLDLSQPTDYFLAQSCLLLSAWECESSRYSGRPDVSQHGNGEMIRNEAFNEAPFVLYRDWILPQNGWFRFDYSSVRRPPPETVSLVEVTEVVRHLRNKANKAHMKIQALRAVSVHVFLSTNHARALISSFPSSEDAPEADNTDDDESTARQEAFCILHTRVFDRFRMLGPELLFSPTSTKKIDGSVFLKNQIERAKRVAKAAKRVQAEKRGPLTACPKGSSTSTRNKMSYSPPSSADPTAIGQDQKEKVKANQQVLPGNVEKALTSQLSKRSQTHGALQHRNALLVQQKELKLLERDAKTVSSTNYSVLVTFTKTDQLALMRRLGLLHLLNPFKPDVHRLPVNTSIYEQHRAVQFLVQLGSQEPVSGSYGRVLCWVDGHQVSLPASWADKGVPNAKIEIIVSFDDSHGHAVPSVRQALADQYTVGFSGGAGFKS